MYVQKISIKIKSKSDRNEIIDEFNSLLSSYRSNGQTQGKIESQYIKNDKIVCLPFTLEKKSLEKSNNNFYVNKQIKKIEDLCFSKLKFKTVGKSYHGYKGACKCKKSDFYILITNYITIESPLICGNCNKSVPLYRLPIYYDYGYLPILSWETNYVSCDSLQMNCEVGERWALNQMEKIDSQLSKIGLEICRKIEELTAIPTFYFLYNYEKVKDGQLVKTCPSCKKKWDLKEPLQDFYDFKCDNCKILSTISPNV